MRKFIPEVLSEINKNPELLFTTYKDDVALKVLFKHAFEPEHKLKLPEGTPPYKQDAAPIGMTPAVLVQELRKMNMFMREDLKPAKREILFIQLLENIHPSEAEVLLTVKDQTLSELYENITHDLVYRSGFVSIAPSTEVKKKRGPKPKEDKQVEEQEPKKLLMPEQLELF